MTYSKENIVLFLFVLLGHFVSLQFGLGITTVPYFLSYLLIICLNDNDKIRCLNFITKWYGYLMLPSLIIYCMLMFVELPSLGYLNAVDNIDWASDSGYGYCENFLFYMRSDFYGGRFNGPFLEPGHVGMMSAFLLFVNHFNFKKKGMPLILLSLLFSLSLAGYVLLFVGFLMHLFYMKKITLQFLCMSCILFFSLYLFGMYYNDGDNFLYDKIFSRLEYDKEKGISGNNRVFGLMDIYYAAMWSDMNTLLWGYPEKTMTWLADTGSRGTGYIYWMCSRGLVGTILVFLMYFFYVIMNRYKTFAVYCLIFVILMFVQRCYPYWTSWIICFVYGITYEKIRIQLNKHDL